MADTEPLPEAPGEETVVVSPATKENLSVPPASWLPIPLGLVASLVSKLIYVDLVAPSFGIDSGWAFNNGILLFSCVLYVVLLSISSLLLYPAGWRPRIDCTLAAGTSLTLGTMFLLIGGILCWPFMILLWLMVTIVWGKYSLAPWRVGIWMGVGGVVIVAMANVLFHLLL